MGFPRTVVLDIETAGVIRISPNTPWEFGAIEGITTIHVNTC